MIGTARTAALRRPTAGVLPWAALAVVGAAALLKRGLVVRAIRAVDRRGGLFTRHAARSYARGTRFLGGFYRRVAADAARYAAGRAISIVDIGSGPGDLLVALAERAPGARLLGVEPSEEMRAIAAERGVGSVAGTAEAMPLADGSVDLIVSTLSSHHWQDARDAFAEIRRVLRAGGEARIYDVRFAGYGRTEAQALAAAAGFGAGEIEHAVLDERILGLRPFSVLTLRGAPRRRSRRSPARRREEPSAAV